MAENAKPQNQAQAKNQAPAAKVVDMPKKCIAEGCTKRDSRMSFCDEHFTWYKEGLVTTKGKLVKDFDKKFQAFMHRKSKSA